MSRKEARIEAHMRAPIMLETAISGWDPPYEDEDDAVMVTEEIDKIITRIGRVVSRAES